MQSHAATAFDKHVAEARAGRLRVQRGHWVPLSHVAMRPNLAAARQYGVPIRAARRRINTYLYLAFIPVPMPEVQRRMGEEWLEQAIGRIDELWQDVYLPEIKRHLQHWEALDTASATADPARDGPG